jgi:hypothetical protein
VPVAVVSIALFAACGGGDDDSPAGGPGGGDAKVSGSDEQYVATLCKASLNFSKSFEDIFKDPKNAAKNEEDAMKLFVEPYEKLVKDMEKANPPKDLKSYHNDMVDSLKKALDGMKKGDIEAIMAVGDTGVPEPPQDVADRLQRAAADNEDCKEADFSFN